MRTVYVNGDYVPEAEAKVSIFDRGFLFADGVYEVTPVIDGRLAEFEGHVKRLHRSLNELGIAAPASDAALLDIHRELVARNGVAEGLVYMQVTRGAADRDFLYPPEDTPPTLVLFTQEKALIDSPLAERGARIAVIDDLRWGRRDIKTVQLLYSSMAKMAAKGVGADDAWFTDDGFITEGTSNNAYIVTAEGTVVTRNLSNAILAGVTRASVLVLEDLTFEEWPFTIDDVRDAAEAFFTSASTLVTPVVAIDGAPIGDGTPGPVTRRIRNAYIDALRRSLV